MNYNESIKIYTGTVCVGNPGEPGGWGAVIVLPDGEEEEIQGAEKHTTQSKIAMASVIRSLNFVKEQYAQDGDVSVILYSDSKYIVKGAMEWAEGWKRNNWCKADGSKAQNISQWEEILDYKSELNVVFLFAPVSGDGGYRERCEELAKDAVRSVSESYNLASAGLDEDSGSGSGSGYPSKKPTQTFAACFDKAEALWDWLSPEQQHYLILEHLKDGDVAGLAAKQNFIADAFVLPDVKRAFVITVGLKAGAYAANLIIEHLAEENS